MAIDKVEIVARVPGFIEQRNFTEGQLVKKGELLFRIEQDTYKAAVDQQTANLAKAKANEINANLQLQRNQALIKSSSSASGDSRSARSRRAGRQGRHFASAGLARAGPNKSCATQRFGPRSTGKSALRNSPWEIWFNRLPGQSRPSSARTRSTLRFNRARQTFSLTSVGLPQTGWQEPALDDSYQIAGRHHLSASRSDQLP